MRIQRFFLAVKTQVICPVQAVQVQVICPIVVVQVQDFFRVLIVQVQAICPILVVQVQAICSVLAAQASQTIRPKWKCQVTEKQWNILGMLYPKSGYRTKRSSLKLKRGIVVSV